MWVCPTMGCGHTEQQPMASEVWHWCPTARKRVRLQRKEE